jgi:hypothetical protein
MSTWTGKGFSFDWNDADNWDSGSPPGEDDDLVVGGGQTYDAPDVPPRTRVKRLFLSGGGLLGAPPSVTERFEWTGGYLARGADAGSAGVVGIRQQPGEAPLELHEGLLEVGSARLENATLKLSQGAHIRHLGRLEFYGDSRFKWSGGIQPHLITPEKGGVLFVGSGTLTVDAVILRVTGIVELAQGVVLSLEGRDGGLHFLDKGARVVGSGKIRVCNGGRLLAVESAVLATGATLELADGGMIEDLPPGKLPYPVLGPIQERQLLRVDGTLLWTGGDIQGAVVVNPGGMLETQGAGDKWVSLGPLRILGAAHLFGPGPVEVDHGAVINEGEVVLHDGMSVVLSRNPRAFTQTAGVLRIDPKAVLRCDDPLTLKGGRLEGGGRIVGDVVQQGTTRPGDIDSTGILTIEGTYKQTSTGRLDVRIQGLQPGSGGYDQLAVTGPVTLGGELRVTVAKDYQPDLGTRFAVVTGAEVDGKFRQITGLGLSAERTLQPIWKTDALELLVAREYETVAVLELGGFHDSKAFVTQMAGTGVLNATPSALENNTVFPTPVDRPHWASFDKGKPPEWWLRRFIDQSPTWLYLSGHFTGSLYNDNESFILNFDNPAADNNVLWKYYRRGSDFRLDDRCRAVIMMGCSAVAHLSATRNIQLMLTGVDDEAPVVLGFRGTCPTRETDELVTLFVQELAKNWDNRFDQLQLTASWLAAGKAWEYNFDDSRPGTRLGYVSREGDAYGVEIDKSDVWSWKRL